MLFRSKKQIQANLAKLNWFLLSLWCLSDEVANNQKKMISFISKNFLGNQTTFLIRKTTKQNKKSTKRIGEAKAFVEDESLSVVYES